MTKQLGALIALAGVVVGGLLQAGFAYMQDEKAFERRSIERIEETTIELSKASRLVSTELRGIEISLNILASQRGLGPATDIKFARSRGLTFDEIDLVPTDDWDAQKDAFAFALGRDTWVELSNFYEAVKARELVINLTKPGQKFSRAEVKTLRAEAQQAGELADFLEDVGEKSIGPWIEDYLDRYYG